MIYCYFITFIYILQVLAGFFHLLILVTFLAFLCHIFAPASIDPAVQHVPHLVKCFLCKRFSCGHDPKRDRMGILRHSRLHIWVFIIKESIPLIKMDSSPRKFFLRQLHLQHNLLVSYRLQFLKHPMSEPAVARFGSFMPS